MGSHRRVAADPYDGPTIEGIDISRWQPAVDFERVVASGISFCIVRAADGKDSDPLFQDRYELSKAAGLVTGSYIYFRADRGGKEQAEAMADRVIRAGYDSEDIPPAVDLERASRKNLDGGIWRDQGPLPHRLVLEETLECLEALESRLGVAPLMYTGEYFHWVCSQAAPDVAPDFAKYPLWVPSYEEGPPRMPSRHGRPFPWREWTIHQYSSRGRVDGVVGWVDLNRMRG